VGARGAGNVGRHRCSTGIQREELSMGRLENKVAFITGAARGQGRSHAVRMAEEGADIIAVDLCQQLETVYYDMPGEEELAETVRLVEEQDRRIVARKADVRDFDALKSAVDAGVAELGRLDIIVANAGISNIGPAVEITDTSWNDVVDIDQKGVFLTVKAAVPHILEHGEGGSIVLTSSAAGLHAFAGLAHYASAKHGVVGLMKVLAVEFGPQKIRVNSIHPTQVNTPMLMNAYSYGLFCPDVENPTVDDFAPVSQSMHTLPVPWVEAVDIANAAVFLCSDEARYITGATLPVDDGADLIA
jgi:SDR family mycofactocin-dependent oxidoreductase